MQLRHCENTKPAINAVAFIWASGCTRKLTRKYRDAAPQVNCIYLNRTTTHASSINPDAEASSPFGLGEANWFGKTGDEKIKGKAPLSSIIVGTCAIDLPPLSKGTSYPQIPPTRLNLGAPARFWFWLWVWVSLWPRSIGVGRGFRLLNLGA